MPKLKGALFESAVIERYRRREQSVEEALIDMYLAGVSTRQVDDISQLLWGDRMPSQTLSDKLKKDLRGDRRVARRGRWNPNTRTCSWTACGTSAHGAGHVENVSVLVAIGVNAEGHREVIGVTEGMKEDSASWEQFFRGMIERGLKGVQAGGRRPVRRTGGHGRLDAAQGEVPAVHGAFHAQRALQGRRRSTGNGRPPP